MKKKRDREWEWGIFHLLCHYQMPLTARVKSMPETVSGSPMWVHGTQLLQLSEPPGSALAGRWTGNEKALELSTPVWEVDLPSGNLITVLNNCPWLVVLILKTFIFRRISTMVFQT